MSPKVSEKMSRTAAPANMPAPVPAFLTEDLTSSLASSISPCRSVEKLACASATREPIVGGLACWGCLSSFAVTDQNPSISTRALLGGIVALT